MRRAGTFSLAFVMLLAGTSTVLAGGYDTPILYSARHMGMGGTAIGFVNDPSAIFHNPAGLSHTKLAGLTVNFSPLIGGILAHPGVAGNSPFEDGNQESINSNLAFSPAFLLGGSYRVADYVTVGLGLYPVAAAAASYNYVWDVNKKNIEDITSLKFIEISPAISFEIPGNLRLGVGYRMTLVMLDRIQKDTAVSDEASIINMKLKGFNFLGFRVGLQWQPLSWLEIGVVYRHKTETTTKADSITIFGSSLKNSEMKFVLPSKLGFGIKADLGSMALAMDLEYNFNEQNKVSTVIADGNPVLENQFRWNNALTFRTGFEKKIAENYAARLGYIFDAKTANEKYPTAFGTPPAPTHSITTGGGYKAESWEVNMAYAYRFGSTTITEADLPTDESIKSGVDYNCTPCGKAGDYAIALHGVYLDYSYYW